MLKSGETNAQRLQRGCVDWRCECVPFGSDCRREREKVKEKEEEREEFMEGHPANESVLVLRPFSSRLRLLL